MIDPRPLWDFSDPVASEARFRAAVDAATSAGDAAVLRTQVARALGLQSRYDEALAELDAVAADEPEVRVRVLLERGRVLRSSGDEDAARPVFRAAAEAADAAGLDALAVDAMHMVALTLRGADQVVCTREALARARGSHEPAARAWTASLLNNLGMAHADLGEWQRALDAFDEALTERRAASDEQATNAARWAVGWALRHVGRRDDALEVQRALRADLVAAGLSDEYVHEELALLEDPRA
ncbi:tetratricopeptide repeat protein [Cellulomonas alba]|uniref:Tetratricopeptide repeat protein n=1 Tax=Cellulomonas alba TaxID=3053467 RepID=A0ABT7SLB5_9CELL|nr:tetratricopeptide repeat protein [Cellulomonas alba]MDM7856319.1 tetratricopeptide repeat protein [Cellulomonas alba]